MEKQLRFDGHNPSRLRTIIKLIERDFIKMKEEKEEEIDEFDFVLRLFNCLLNKAMEFAEAIGLLDLKFEEAKNALLERFAPQRDRDSVVSIITNMIPIKGEKVSEFIQRCNMVATNAGLKSSEFCGVIGRYVITLMRDSFVDSIDSDVILGLSQDHNNDRMKALSDIMKKCTVRESVGTAGSVWTRAKPKPSIPVRTNGVSVEKEGGVGGEKPESKDTTPRTTKTLCPHCGRGYHREEECWQLHPELKRVTRSAAVNEEKKPLN